MYRVRANPIATIAVAPPAYLVRLWIETAAGIFTAVMSSKSVFTVALFPFHLATAEANSVRHRWHVFFSASPSAGRGPIDARRWGG
jgi:hypothetical protein